MRNSHRNRMQQGPVRPYPPRGLHLSRADNEVATSAFRKAMDAEPRITAVMHEIVKTHAGARQAALEDRILSADGYRAAVALEMRVEPDVRVVTADMRDVVRYTVELPFDDYASTASLMTEQLQEQGVSPVSWRDTWGSSGYKGINSTWRDPRSEQLFSVQFHTPESRTAKERVHRMQDELRLLGDSVVDGFDWQGALTRRPDEAQRVGRVLAGGPGVVAFIAERRLVVREALPVLLRNWRDRAGHVHEQVWLPREREWEVSWRQKDAWLGINDDEFEELDEQEALAVFEARQQQVVSLDEAKARRRWRTWRTR